MKNMNAEALYAHLFAAMERVNVESGSENPEVSAEQIKEEIEKAEAVASLAKCIIDLAKEEQRAQIIELKKAAIRGKSDVLLSLPENTNGFFATK